MMAQPGQVFRSDCVLLFRIGARATILIDGSDVTRQSSSSVGSLSSLNGVSSLYVGGVDATVGEFAGYGMGLSGCIDSLSVDGMSYDFNSRARVVNGDDVSACQ